MYVNAPRYLLRKRLVLELLRDMKIGKCLEIGCGAGDLSATLYNMGYHVKGIDSSERAIQLCHEMHKDICQTGTIHFAFESIYDVEDTFDTIFMFEVLEHIEDDRAALSRVHKLLRPAGHILLSVPAHESSFGASDVFAGHYRRYDRAKLLALLAESRFGVQTIWSYGVPLANLTEKVRNVVHGNKPTQSKETATAQSGIDRSIEAKLRFFCNDFFLYPFYWMQGLFLNSDLGTGYIVKAKKTI
ncbi:MAG: class I SAM-dependent methyltransferase [Candidatus Binatia bacterium]